MAPERADRLVFVSADDFLEAKLEAQAAVSILGEHRVLLMMGGSIYDPSDEGHAVYQAPLGVLGQRAMC